MIDPRLAARIAHPALEFIARSIPDLAPMVEAINGELERIYPELQVIAGPEEPPVVPPSYRVGPGVSAP